MPATGKITQVIGSTFDAEFPEDQMPRIYNAVKIDAEQDGHTIHLTGEIASHLGLSRQTVPGHIKNIYRKLEVHTRGEAVFEAVQQGLIKL